MSTRIAVLGWGSLLWDQRPEFDDQHGQWEPNGPELMLEFSRVSKSRRGALTLVIEPTNGAPCRVAYAWSKRRDPEDAICDLRSREGTTRSNIGYHFADGSRNQSRDSTTLAAIQAWATKSAIDVVVWTDLQSNFQRECGKPFSVQAALAHLQALDASAKAGAVEYLWRAPALVKTALRTALEVEPWFTP